MFVEAEVCLMPHFAGKKAIGQGNKAVRQLFQRTEGRNNSESGIAICPFGAGRKKAKEQKRKRKEGADQPSNTPKPAL